MQTFMDAAREWPFFDYDDYRQLRGYQFARRADGYYESARNFRIAANDQIRLTLDRYGVYRCPECGSSVISFEVDFIGYDQYSQGSDGSLCSFGRYEEPDPEGMVNVSCGRCDYEAKIDTGELVRLSAVMAACFR